MANTFLRAEWRKLIMANYEIDPAILKPYLPYKTELDTWNNRYYISLVGFRFLNTAIMGIRIPFHVNFPEINLRFYVRYNDGTGWKRGVVFLKEIVPKPAISFVANNLYQEKYMSLPVKSTVSIENDLLDVSYQWKFRGKWNKIAASAGNSPTTLKTGSEEEYITEHFWGYSKGRGNTTTQYQVEHPRWDIYGITNFEIDCNFAALYGQEFACLDSALPLSVFMAEGSAIAINQKTIIR